MLHTCRRNRFQVGYEQNTCLNTLFSILAYAMNETIKKMSPDDLDDVMEIEKLSFVSPWTKRFFEETLTSPISLNLVMKKGTETIGYIILYTVADEAHIEYCHSSQLSARRFKPPSVCSYFKRKDVREFFLSSRRKFIGNQSLWQIWF